MNARISAMMCLLCVLGSSDLTRAEDPSSQRVADPYAISPDPPTMSSGTLEPYISVMAGIAVPRSHDATFTDGTQPRWSRISTIRRNTRSAATRGSGFQPETSCGDSISAWKSRGFIWYADVACCKDNYNRDPATGDGHHDGETGHLRRLQFPDSLPHGDFRGLSQRAVVSVRRDRRGSASDGAEARWTTGDGFFPRHHRRTGYDGRVSWAWAESRRISSSTWPCLRRRSISMPITPG